MWTRTELKEKAKPAFKANYWVSVLAAIICIIFAGASGSSSRHSSSDATHDIINKGGSAFAFFIAFLAGVTVITALLIVLKIVVVNALIVGAQKVFISNEESDDKTPVSEIGFAFREGYWKNVAVTMFLKDLFTALWTLLFVIPGIIKSYEYRMIPYLLARNPEMSYSDAFAKSKEMMAGQKWNAFILDLSFIGWFLLSGITFGVLGVFYVYPYFYQTSAELFLSLEKMD